MSERCADTLLAEGAQWAPYYWYMMGFTAVLDLIACVACIYAIIIILANRDVRDNTFNLYVAFMLIPDCVNTFLNFLMGAFRIRHCGRVVTIVDYSYDFNVSFYYFCNFSLNCAVAWEINSLLNQARRLHRAGPPPMKQTLLRIFGAYSLALLFAVWGVVDIPWSWYYRRRQRFGSPPGGLFSEMQAIAMVGTMMILFVVGIRIHIWRKQLLPKKGRTRVLSIFFERIVVVFLAFYFPTLTLLMLSTVFETGYSHQYFWIERSIQFLSALQVFTTLWAVSRNPDIQDAVFRCWRKRSSSVSGCLARRRVTEESETTGGTINVEHNAMTSGSVAAPNYASRQQPQRQPSLNYLRRSGFLRAPDLAATETEWEMLDVYDSDESEAESVVSPVVRDDDGAADEETTTGGADQQSSTGMNLGASREDSTILGNDTNESTECFTAPRTVLHTDTTTNRIKKATATTTLINMAGGTTQRARRLGNNGPSDGGSGSDSDKTKDDTTVESNPKGIVPKSIGAPTAINDDHHTAMLDYVEGEECTSLTTNPVFDAERGSTSS